MLKNTLRQLCPPLIWSTLSRVRGLIRPPAPHAPAVNPENQELGIYWDPEFAKLLETWGEGNMWNEIQLLLVNCSGRVLDCACGTGTVIERLRKYPRLEVHGFDISDFLIGKAVERGIPRERLTVADATQTPYPDERFDYSYSIGSMEHFTEEGIEKFMADNHRVTKIAGFHSVPVSRSGRNEGWINLGQSYFNNSIDWWLEKFQKSYRTVYVFDSRWDDALSVGKWFVCLKRGETKF
jgi:ubiquinone/menaquinone biosynthesis C-methylase UbiE